jgi:hypothetical protein
VTLARPCSESVDDGDFEVRRKPLRSIQSELLLGERQAGVAELADARDLKAPRVFLRTREKSNDPHGC